MTYLEIKRELLEKTKTLIEQNAHHFLCTAFVRSAHEMRSNHELDSVYKSLVYEAWWHYDQEVHEILQGQDVEEYLLAKRLDIDPKQFRLDLLTKWINDIGLALKEGRQEQENENRTRT